MRSSCAGSWRCRHDVFLVCAEYDSTARHGTIRWRAFEGLPVIEIVNNWECDRFEDSYASPRITSQLGHVLEATRPDILHVHNLLNLSFDLPRLARARGIATTSQRCTTTRWCVPSGGQRVHVAESHVCETIDPDRCSRCFAVTPFRAQMAAAAMARAPGGGVLRRVAETARRVLPVLTDAAARRIPMSPATSGADLGPPGAGARRVLRDRLLRRALGGARRRVPGAWPGSAAARDLRLWVRGGSPQSERRPRVGPLRVGFVGSLVWHKGAHVLIEAARRLHGSYEIAVHGDPTVGPEYHARLVREAAGLAVRFAGPFDRERGPARVRWARRARRSRRSGSRTLPS